MAKIFDISNTEKTFYFDSFQEFKTWVDDNYFNNLSNAKTTQARSRLEGGVASNASDISWYGTTNVSKVDDINEFLFNNELDRYLNDFQNRTVSTDATDLEQKRKIKFTSLEIGIFSFDLASAGLIREYEYYSSLLNSIVDSSKVFSRDESGKTVFYHFAEKEIPEHDLIMKNGLLKSGLLNMSFEPDSMPSRVNENGLTVYYHPYTPEIPEHIVEQRQKTTDDGQPKFTSTTKKSFIYMPPLEGILPKIDLVATVSFSSSVRANSEMLYNCFAPIAVGLKLEKSNVKTSLYSITSFRMENNRRINIIFKIKDQSERIDKNRIASIFADGRFFRRNFFKCIVSTAEAAGFTDYFDQFGLGYPENDTTYLRQRMTDCLERLKQYDDYGKKTVSMKNKIFFRQCLSQNAAEAEYNRVVQEIKQLMV